MSVKDTDKNVADSVTNCSNCGKGPIRGDSRMAPVCLSCLHAIEKRQEEQAVIDERLKIAEVEQIRKNATSCERCGSETREIVVLDGKALCSACHHRVLWGTGWWAESPKALPFWRGDPVKRPKWSDLLK